MRQRQKTWETRIHKPVVELKANFCHICSMHCVKSLCLVQLCFEKQFGFSRACSVLEKQKQVLRFIAKLSNWA